MSKSFYVSRNKDAADYYVKALLSAGFTETRKMDKADFLLVDHEHKGARYSETKPVFIYPHTPYAYWLWDGIYPAFPVACNFVVGSGAVNGMKAYGYPYRVEAVGFTGCDVKDFQSTKGTRLLFAPPHLLGNSSYAGRQPKDIYKTVFSVWEFIKRNLSEFENVTVRHNGTLEQCGISFIDNPKIIYNHVDPYRKQNIRLDSLKAIERADIVISCNTFGMLSIASGKPTVMIGYKDTVPSSGAGFAKSYNKYKASYEFPHLFEDMGIDDLMNIREEESDILKKWKNENIGGDFDADKFISVIREYVN